MDEKELEEDLFQDEQEISRAKAKKLLQNFDFSKLYTKKRASSSKGNAAVQRTISGENPKSESASIKMPESARSKSSLNLS